jgi:GT2 family glycosyltransferase
MIKNDFNKSTCIVVVTYNSEGYISECINSILKVHPDVKIIVIDNNSRDGTVAEVSNFKKVHLIKNDFNLGFAGGCNMGIKYGMRKGYDYYMLINPDVTIIEPMLSQLVERSRTHNSIVGPVILDSSSKKIQCAGGSLNKITCSFKYRNRNKEYKKSDLVENVDWILGAAFLVNRDIINKNGLFDEDYFPAYVEEADYCFRANKNFNIKSEIVYSSYVHHVGGTSSGKTENYYKRLTKNRLFFAIKHLPAFYYFTSSLGIILKTTIYKVFGRYF